MPGPQSATWAISAHKLNRIQSHAMATASIKIKKVPSIASFAKSVMNVQITKYPRAARLRTTESLTIAHTQQLEPTMVSDRLVQMELTHIRTVPIKLVTAYHARLAITAQSVRPVLRKKLSSVQLDTTAWVEIMTIP